MIVKFFQLCNDTREIKELLKTRSFGQNASHSLPSVKVDINSVKTASMPIGKASPTDQKVRIGSFGICTFVNGKPIGKYNYIAENGQNITLNAKDAENLVTPV